MLSMPPAGASIGHSKPTREFAALLVSTRLPRTLAISRPMSTRSIASTGKLIWKVHVDDHPSARITGAPKVFEGHLYVPVASGRRRRGRPGRTTGAARFAEAWSRWRPTGRQIWKTYTIADAPQQAGKNTNGVQRWAPAGGGVWNSPTIDPKRHALYVGTGDAYTAPAPKTTDSIMAMDLDTGKILWSVQDTQNDTWLAGCTAREASGELSRDARAGSRFRLSADPEDVTERQDAA